MSTSEDFVDLPDVVVEEVSPENVLDDALVFLQVMLEETFAVGVPVIPPFCLEWKVMLYRLWLVMMHCRFYLHYNLWRKVQTGRTICTMSSNMMQE
jgi:hypothetical protein